MLHDPGGTVEKSPGIKTYGSEWVAMEPSMELYGYRVLSEQGEDMGTVADYIFDEAGCLRYLVVERGFWIFGRKFLVPAGLAHVEDRLRRITLEGVDKDILEDLPSFEGLEDLDDDYEDELMRVYRDCLAESQEFVGARHPIGVGNREEDLFRLPDRLKVLEERLDLGMDVLARGNGELRS